MNDPHEYSGLYALDALDPTERAEFEAHLAGCDACQREVVEFRDTMTVVASVVSHDDIAFDDIAFDDRAFDADLTAVATGDGPPASIRSRVLDDITSNHASAATVASLSSAREARSARHGRARQTKRLWMPAAAAAVLISVVSVVLTTRDGGQSDLALLTELQSQGSPTVTMSGGGEARLVISESGDRAVIVASGLAVLDDDHRYQAWTIGSSGDPVRAPMFRPDASGNAVVALRSLPDDLDTIAVTIEPKAGSKLPTTPVLLSAKVA